jgi:alkanesulfonate monooxygenase SsuD/methylene tetrahydromethanopterin reductase-like flavin-dependent oxidoreductase (luciferase family)
MTVAAIKDMARAAHASGVDGLFIGGHLLAGPHLSYPDTITTLSYLAGYCPGMILGTSILILPLHKPVLLAEQLATLDAVTGGNLIVGVGQGYRDMESAAVGLDKPKRAQRLREGLAVMRALWSEELVTMEGLDYQLDGVGAAMRPARVGGPPIMIAADTTRTVANVARLGGHWQVSGRHSLSFIDEMLTVYKKALADEGREYSGVPMGRELAVGPPDLVEGILRKYNAPYYEEYLRRQQPGEDYTSTSWREDFGNRVIHGSSEEVAEQIIDTHRRTGCEFMFFRVSWPDMPLEITLEMVTRLGLEVIPIVKAAVGDGCKLFEPA